MTCRKYSSFGLLALSFFLSSFFMTSCTRERNSPGYYYFNDMTPSIPYDYYSENPNFKTGETAQMTVKGSIPKGFVPYSYPKTADGQKLAGLELICLIKDTPENIDTGRVRFNTYCAMCHGEKGDGKGNLVTTKKFNKDVTSLVGDFVQKKPDGELFHVITLGSVSGFMGSHSAQLNPDDRWRIVRYIKTKLKLN
ncbi:MAG: hypothetical protein A2046_04515 [Bacteroidetes bacterium GWA2_30_7]|nr:MAG: hypothetical protein A2046_04515 [Bacteroidetes bacterium GWA2_30_7]